MAYNNYAFNPDGSVTFTDPSGGAPPVVASGAAAQAQIQKIRGAQLDPSIAAAATAPPPDRLASNSDQDKIAGSLGLPGGAPPSRPGNVLDVGAGALPPTIARPDEEPVVAPKFKLTPQAVQAGLAGQRAPTAAPFVPAEKSIAQTLGAQDAPLPSGVRPAVPTSRKPGAVDPSHLVGAGPSNDNSDRIPTVTTGPTGGGGGRDTLRLAGVQEQSVVHDPNALAHLKRGEQNEYEAGEALTEAEQAQAGNIAAQGRIANDRLRTQQSQVELAEKLRQQSMREDTEKLRSLMAETRNNQIDESRYYHNMSTGDKVSAALAIALGAWAGGRTGVNHAQEIYDKAVDRDIDEQKQNLANAKGKLEDQKGLLGVMRQNFGDERQSEAATRLAYLDDAQRQVQQIMAESQSPIIQAKGKAMLASLQQKSALQEDAFNQHGENKTFHMVSSGGGGSTVVPHADIKKEETVLGPDGRRWEFGAGTTAQDAAKQLAQSNQSLDLIRDLRENAAKVSKNPLDTNARARVTSAAAQLRQTAGKAEAGGSGGKFSKEFVDNLDQAMGGNQSAITNLGKSAGLNQFEQGIRSEADNVIRQHSLSEVEEFQEQNPRTGEETLRFRRKKKGPGPKADFSGSEVGEAE